MPKRKVPVARKPEDDPGQRESEAPGLTLCCADDSAQDNHDADESKPEPAEQPESDRRCSGQSDRLDHAGSELLVTNPKHRNRG
jgi:hypothetical protein